MPESYLPIVVLIAAATGLAFVILVLSALLGRSRRRGTAKLYPYECGLPVSGSARQRFSVRFYVVAMLFILFDLETAFLFPWAVVYRRLGMYGLVSMFVFIGILLVGFAYAWRKGGLQWT
jgi:NADH-quinone oxidoreductase subunit A